MAVIGASIATGEVCASAREVGAAIAARGWSLACGGGGGVMEAACAGFVERRGDAPGGVCVGILPGEDAAFANEHVELAIPTGLGWARNAVIARMADAVVAIGGCSGTLSEIAFAWQMGKPIVALTTTGGWAARLAGEALDSRREDRIMAAADAAEVVARLVSHLEAKGA